MSNSKRNVGQMMIDHLLAVGRAKRKAGTATTAELAEVAGIPTSQAYSRLYWLEVKDGRLESTGKGSSRVWRLAKRVKAVASEVTEKAPKAPRKAKAPKVVTEASEVNVEPSEIGMAAE